ncbi:MAG: ABC transporter permease [Thioalkalivibrio sp.]|nr:ABC transporter permease [Thioalkalivibrio sp.]
MAVVAFSDSDRAYLTERVVPFGDWVVGWGAGTSLPAVEQAAQVQALRGVTTGLTGLVALLAFATLIMLRRQELRIRAAEHYLHWAVGARRIQLVARFIGRTWVWALVAGSIGFCSTALIPRLIEASFPGAAHVPIRVAPFLILTTVLGVLFLKWESRAGEQVARSRRHSVGRVASGPVSISALGFAILTGIGLLSTYTPTGDPDGQSTLLTAGVSLGDMPHPAGMDELMGWVGRAAATTGPLGLASAGTVRGTGVGNMTWVDCGRCFEGGLPLPFRTVRTEVFAVNRDTFPHLGLELLEGRGFDDLVDSAKPSVAIVSRALAGRHFESGQAVGRRIRVGDSDWLTVIGIVTDRSDIRDHMEYAAYLPVTQVRPAELEVIGQTSKDHIRRAAEVVPAGISVSDPKSLAEVFAVHSWFGQALGLVAVLSYVMVLFGAWIGASNEARATEFEISLRKAVGAKRSDLIRHFVSRTAGSLAVALGVGAWLALFLGVGLNDAYGGIPQADLSVSLRAAFPVIAAFVVGFWPSYARSIRRTPSAGLRAAE